MLIIQYHKVYPFEGGSEQKQLKKKTLATAKSHIEYFKILQMFSGQGSVNENMVFKSHLAFKHTKNKESN